tara:strand:+ start:1117 stop:1335 length:219 start_codon:yes stop_codon:yes gene_type:complete
MWDLLENQHVRSNLAGFCIAVAIALQFLPLLKEKLNGVAEKHPIVKLLQSRSFQLGVGFVLLTIGIEITRLN